MCSCIEVINDTRLVKARKDYRDMCREYIMEALDTLRVNPEEYKLSFKEWRLIAESIRDNWKIKKGDLYELQVNKMDGNIYAFRSKIGLVNICSKYDLFGECC